MKANRSLRTETNAQADIQTVVGVVALLLTIVIGVLIYFEVIESADDFTETTEYFKGYDIPTSTDPGNGDNATDTTVTLRASPYSTSNGTISVVCYNATGNEPSSPTVKINGRQVTIPAAPVSPTLPGDTPPLGYTQINITYTSNAARAQSNDVTPMAQTVFQLLPLIALVVVASILLVIVLSFGGTGRKGGGL